MRLVSRGRDDGGDRGRSGGFVAGAERVLARGKFGWVSPVGVCAASGYTRSFASAGRCRGPSSTSKSDSASVAARLTATSPMRLRWDSGAGGAASRPAGVDPRDPRGPAGCRTRSRGGTDLPRSRSTLGPLLAGSASLGARVRRDGDLGGRASLRGGARRNGRSPAPTLATARTAGPAFTDRTSRSSGAAARSRSRSS